MRFRTRYTVFSLSLILGACGTSGSIDFENVAGLPAGDAVGGGLSGEFSALYTRTSNGCKDLATELELSAEDDPQPLDLEVKQEEGVLSFKKLGVSLKGGIQFNNDFEVGGVELLNIGTGNENNILRMIHLTGTFDTANLISAKGSERYQGILGNDNVDCSFSVELTAVRN